MKMKLIIPALMAAAAMTSHAAVVVTPVATQTNRTAYTVSSSDLIQNGASTLSGGPTISSGSFTPLNSTFVLSNINDGDNSNTTTNDASGGSTTDTTYDGTAAGTFNYAVDFTLNTATNTLGYDLTSTVTTTNGSDRRVNQNFEIYYTTVSNPTFVLLKAYTFTSTPNGTSQGNGSARVTLTEDTGNNVLASGVNAIRLRVLTAASLVGASNNASPVITEFDVFGAATVPEPSSLLLSALGGLALLRRRR